MKSISERRIDSVAEALVEAEVIVGEHTKGASPTVVDALFALTRAIQMLGNADATTPLGGMEALGKAMLESSDRIAGALGDLADAIRETKE